MFYSANTSDFFESPKSLKTFDPEKENFEPSLLKTVKKPSLGRIPLADITPKGEEGKKRREERTMMEEEGGTERKVMVRLFR